MIYMNEGGKMGGEIVHKKKKLSIDEILADIKSKGITFKHTTEEEAKNYLLYSTYYFKLKSYAKNYAKNPVRKKYSGLDFSYLQDLARLDMHFRELVVKMTIDIEHLVKVQILAHSQQNEKDDGYKIVSEFLFENEDIKQNLESHSKNAGYSSSLIQSNLHDLPIWVFLETISFGELTRFYDFYAKRFSVGSNISAYLWSVRIMRNAAAHNACILNRMTEYFGEKKINYTLRNAIKRAFPYINTKKLKHYLMNPVMQDFLDILMVFSFLDKPRHILKKRLSEFEIFLRRCRKHATYYKSNNEIVAFYSFLSSFYKEYKSNL